MSLKIPATNPWFKILFPHRSFDIENIIPSYIFNDIAGRGKRRLEIFAMEFLFS
jgi:hypothetical protein